MTPSASFARPRGGVVYCAPPPAPPTLYVIIPNGPCPCVVAAVDENGVEEGLLQDSLAEPIVKMAVAPNGRFLACFSRDGMLAVMSSNFATKVGKAVGFRSRICFFSLFFCVCVVVCWAFQSHEDDCS